MSAASLMSWALETGFAVSVLIVMVLLIRRPVARYLGAGAAYALWSLPLLRLVMPAIPLPAKMIPAPLMSPMPMNTEFFVMATSDPAPVTTALPWALMALVIWISCAALWLAYQSYRQMQFKSDLLSQSAAISPKLRAMAETLGTRLNLKTLPDIRLSVRAHGPLVTGLIKPIIFLPLGFENQYSASQQKLALAHELSHVRRGDLWAAGALLCFRAINWPNPLAHVAATPFRADQEAACDQTVLSRLGNGPAAKTNYAETLIHAAKLAGHPVKPHPLGLTIYNPLKERIIMMKVNPTSRLTLRLAASGLAMAALIATAPYTRATGHDSSEATTTTKSVEKKVMKWVTKDDAGVESNRHVEIVTENGATRAYEIDAEGNKTEIDPASVDMPDMPEMKHGMEHKMDHNMDHSMDHDMGAHSGDHPKRMIIKKIVKDGVEMDIEEMTDARGDMKVIVKRMGDDGELQILSEEVLGDMEGVEGLNGNKQIVIIEKTEDVDVTSDGQHKVIVKRMHGPSTSYAYSDDEDFEFTEGGNAKIMVKAASHMLDNVKTDDMDSKAKKKVVAAQKALKEAMDALGDE